MTTLSIIILILTILVSIFSFLILIWTYIALHRRKKGLKDFKTIPFFSEMQIIESDITIEETPKISISIKQKSNKKKNYNFSYDINEIDSKNVCYCNMSIN